MDNTAAFHINSSRYFLYHDTVTIVNSMVKISLRWDWALSNNNVCRNREQSKKTEASAQEITPNNFSDILSGTSAKIFFTQGNRVLFRGSWYLGPFSFDV